MTRREAVYMVCGGILVGIGLAGLAFELFLVGTRRLEQKAIEAWREAYRCPSTPSW